MKKLLITMGDPAGIGPEITVKLLQKITRQPDMETIVIGEKEILDDTAARLNSSVTFSDSENEDHEPGISYRTVGMGLLQQSDFNFGTISEKTGEAAFQYFTRACDMCLQKNADAIVTAPISKEAINLAGHTFMGHTEILAHLTGIENVMAIWNPGLVVGHVTDHVPLKKALASITPQRINRVVKLTTDFLKTLGKQNPRIALAGVNPHAGEGGILGSEEREILIPTMEILKKEGYPTLGPVSGDSVFYQALGGRYDGVIAMYHDQGFGPMKTHDPGNSVNVTLGLPFVRTSPDHGTALDIAGKGIADESSMLAAYNLAVRLISL